MKTSNLLLTCASIGLLATQVASQSIPNGNFENWTNIKFEIPQNYQWCSNTDALRKNLPFNLLKSTDAYHGTYAVKMLTEIGNGDTVPGIFVNIIPNDDNPANWKGGFAINQKPSGLRGYYKSAISAPDTGFIIAFFYKSGVNIGQYGFYLYGTHSTYTAFSFNFYPALPLTPDTVIFGAGSSNYSDKRNMRNGSMLLLDSLSFTGISSQPALFNGDFESWNTTNFYTADNWNVEGSGENNLTGGVTPSSDAKAGLKSVQVVTYLGERNNHPVAQSGRISTGWYPGNCYGNCIEQGGFPYTKQNDTLAFWYKYAPNGNTQATLNLNFKKNGNTISNAGINLDASATFLYKEIIFNVGQNPDTVIVDIQSSNWQDSAFSFIGTTLIIDEIHFKSQPLNTGIFENKVENLARIFPNPSKGELSITLSENSSELAYLAMYNLFGQEVFSQSFIEKSNATQLNLSQLEDGIYFLRIAATNQNYCDKKIVISK